MCGSASVVPVDDQGQAFAPGASEGTSSAGAVPPPPSFDEIRDLFGQGLAYVQERDAVRAERDKLLDAAESDRRERVAHAKTELLVQATTLVETLSELAQAATSFLKLKTSPSPVVE